MITIGLTTWSDHPRFAIGSHPPTLAEYASFLPVVEVDTPFYALPKPATIVNWQHQVPSQFQFILKANRLMTMHDLMDQPANAAVKAAVFQTFRRLVAPLVAAHQLKTVLFQFPPFFALNAENLAYFTWMRAQMGALPITVELRNPTWFQPSFRPRLIETMQQLKMTLAMIDEPHNLNDGVPFCNAITNPELALLRLHGRNAKGWFERGAEWRKTRTLYRYSDQEIAGLAKLVQQIAPQVKEVCVIFNNNSGKDAAPNALALQAQLGLHFTGLAPRQLDLF